jgi:amino acid adenylation domain-containing protein
MVINPKNDTALVEAPTFVTASSERRAPLSFAQQRLWFLDQLVPNSPFYNLPGAVRLDGRLDLEVLESVINEIVKRHETLRTRFEVEEGEPVQVIDEWKPRKLEVEDLTGLPREMREAEARRITREEAETGFELDRGPLLRVKVLKLEEERHVALFNLHHIIGDAWSMGLLVREVGLLYEAMSRGQRSPLPEPEIQYADYAVWQREYLGGGALEREVRYWKEQLKGAAVMDLPADHARPAVSTYRGGRERVEIDKKLSDSLRLLSQREGASLFMALMAAFKALLMRYSGEEDVSVGTAITNRTRRGVAGLIGFFVNTLVMRTDLSGNPSFRELIRRERKVALEAYAHQEAPFEKVVEEINPDRNLSRSPLFAVMMVLEDARGKDLEIKGLKAQWAGEDAATAKFDLELVLTQSREGIDGSLEYSCDLYEGETIRRMARHFEKVVAEVVRDPDQRIKEIDLMSGSERERILVKWNQTAIDYPRDRTIHELFEEQAESRPDAVAVAYRDQELSYRELNARANHMAGTLLELGVGPEAVVALLAERGIDFLIAILAVFKAGGAYLPLDPRHPAQRICQTLGRSGAGLVMTTSQFGPLAAEAVAGLTAEDRPAVFFMEELFKEPGQEENLGRRFLPNQLSYVIFTSGSTGAPKGAMVEHRGMLNHLLAKVRTLGLDDRDAIAQTASQCFDISVWQFLAALLVGGRVDVFDDEVAHDPASLLDQIGLRKVTILEVVPSLMRMMLTEADRRLADNNSKPELSSLRWMIPTGEALPPGLCHHWFRLYPEIPLLNAYGPTECSDDVTHCPVDEVLSESAARTPIGRPIANTQIYVLDGDLRPQPMGVVGELYVGGECVGRGYLNEAGKTSEYFIPDAFARVAGTRLYKSGDLARYLPDGNLEYLARIDHQVKIRGFRIEPGEIEAAIRRHPLVAEVVVVAREDTPGEKRLVAYLVARPETTLSISDLRDFLRRELPEYMAPAAYVALDALPLTENGKLDRQALPAPEGTSSELERGYVAPRTLVEQRLAEIWSQVLGVDQVGVHSDFFDLGGHSLLATQVMSRARSAFQVELPLRILFEHPTISELGRKVEQAIGIGSGFQAPPLVRAPRDGQRAPLSFAQQRLWFIEQLEPGAATYNIPGAVRLQGTLDLDALESVINEIVRRHETLRTRFEVEHGAPLQVIYHWEPRKLEMEDLTGLPREGREEEARKILREEAAKGFDLSQGPLMRVKVLKLEEDERLVFFNMHHIISDGWSMGILISEVNRLYGAYARGEESPLEEMAIQYADYAVWQREWLQGAVLERQLAYWKQQLAGVPSLLQLPTDRPRVAVDTYHGAYERFALNQELANELKRLSRSEGATLFMTLLAGFQILLARYSGAARIAVGVPVAGRNREETEGLIGFFVNTLVMVADTSGNPTARELLRQVRGTAIGAFAHQDLPFERLVEELQPERGLGQPLFQVMFTFQNFLEGPLAISNLKVKEERIEVDSAKFELALTIDEDGDRVTGTIEYARDLYERETIILLSGHLTRLLEGMVAGQERGVLDIPLLTEREWGQVLEWNRTALEYGAEKCLHEVFEEQARRAPDRVAGVDEVGAISYGGLNRRANQLGNYLRRRGVGPEARVGICLERGTTMLVGLLGILKAGGAYVPLDPAYPAERLAFLLDDARVQLIVTQEKLGELLESTRAELISIDGDFGAIAREREENIDGGVTSENLAYVIYTSGSTGRPKGAMVTHQSVVNLVADARDKFRLERDSKFFQFASLSFDVAVEEIFPTLSVGGVVALQSDNLLYSYSDLAKTIDRHEVTTIELPTVYWREWMRDLSRRQRRAPRSLNLVIIGGERISSEILKEWRGHEVPLLHVYGVTEVAVTSTVYPIPADLGDEAGLPEIPIGRPMANTEVYLLDDRLQPTPLRIPGEMYLGGVGLARGYLNRPDLTAERFVPSSFGIQPGSRLYRTGDLARSSPEGCMEFIGRIDRQIKIRGHRIEPVEIESVLMQLPSVSECVVVARGDEPDDRRLVAYLVLKEGEAETALELRRFMKQRLPAYLVPSSFVILESLPLSPHGKVDRQALPPPGIYDVDLGGEYVAPSTPIEEDVARIFGAALGIDDIGIYDDFFDLGGHSLLVTQVVSRVNSAFQIELPVRALFDAPTVSGVVAAIVESQVGQSEDNVLSQMLAELELLSDDEVDAAFSNGAAL